MIRKNTCCLWNDIIILKSVTSPCISSKKFVEACHEQCVYQYQWTKDIQNMRNLMLSKADIGRSEIFISNSN